MVFVIEGRATLVLVVVPDRDLVDEFVPVVVAPITLVAGLPVLLAVLDREIE